MIDYIEILVRGTLIIVIRLCLKNIIFIKTTNINQGHSKNLYFENKCLLLRLLFLNLSFHYEKFNKFLFQKLKEDNSDFSVFNMDGEKMAFENGFKQVWRKLFQLEVFPFFIN